MQMCCGQVQRRPSSRPKRATRDSFVIPTEASNARLICRPDESEQREAHLSSCPTEQRERQLRHHDPTEQRERQLRHPDPTEQRERNSVIPTQPSKASANSVIPTQPSNASANSVIVTEASNAKPICHSCMWLMKRN